MQPRDEQWDTGIVYTRDFAIKTVDIHIRKRIDDVVLLHLWFVAGDRVWDQVVGEIGNRLKEYMT